MMMFLSATPPVPETLWQSWSSSPLLLLSLLVGGLLYARGLAVLWRQAGPGRGVSYGRALSFAAGVLVLFVTLLSPLEALAEALLVAHMAQHLLLLLVAPPLLINGSPVVAVTWAAPRAWRRGLARWSGRRHLAGLWALLSRPGFAWAAYALALWLWHLPRLYQAALFDETVHALEHACFLGAGLLFWWTVAERGQRDLGMVLFFVFTTALHSGLLGALLTFSPRVLYPAYSIFSYPWGLTPLADQQLAGAIMSFPTSLVFLGVALTLLGRRLYGEERRLQGRLRATTPTQKGAHE